MTGATTHRRSCTTGWLRQLCTLLALLVTIATSDVSACTLSPSILADLGSYSPVAVEKEAVPALRVRGGLICDVALLKLLSGDYIRARFNSVNGLKLVRTDGAGSLAYTASAQSNGATPFAQGTRIDYMQNNLLNVLGLLGGSSADLPFFIKLSASGLPPVGTYTDRVTLTWSWYLCPGGIGLAGLCVGGADSGTGNASIDIKLTVTRRDVVISLTTAATWDPNNGTNRPKAIPGSRGRMSVNIVNPDLVPLDDGTLAIVLPRPSGTIVALDGDGTPNATVVSVKEGAVPSSVVVRYGGPSDQTDDVDFSSDRGQSWSYAPSSDATTQAAITHVRLRPRGAMARESSVSLSVPYVVR